MHTRCTYVHKRMISPMKNEMKTKKRMKQRETDRGKMIERKKKNRMHLDSFSVTEQNGTHNMHIVNMQHATQNKRKKEWKSK